MAYSFITIPSMHDIFIRMKLYLLCGQTALANRAVGQSDAFFKAAISLLAEVPRQVCVFGSKMGCFICHTEGRNFVIFGPAKLLF